VLVACVAAYVALFVAVGLYAARRVRNAADYAVARGGFGTVVVAATVFTTWFGAETVLGIPAVFIKEGVGGLAADPFAAVGCLVLVALVFARPLFRLDIITLGDFFRARFDRRTDVLLSSCIAFSYLGWIAAQLVALGVAFNAISGGAIPMPAGIVGGALIVLAYTMWGGMWSVALTDFVQAIVIVGGLGFVAWVMADAAGGAARVFEAAAAGGRISFPWPGDLKGALALISATSVVLLGSVPQQDVLQRVKSARDESTAVRATLLGGCAYFVVACVPMFLMTAATLIDPALVNARLGDDAQLILPTLVLERTPVYVQALFFGALLSAIFSTASGALLAPAVTIAENLVRPLLRDRGEKAALRTMRLTVLALAIGVTAMALASRESIYDLVNNSGKVVLATSFVPLAAGLFWRRATATAAFASAAAGLVVWLAGETITADAVLPPVTAGFLAGLAVMLGLSIARPAWRE
jgi:Na+/proline symporter